MMRIKFFSIEEGKTVATNIIIISKDKQIYVAKQSDIVLQRNSFIFVVTFSGYSFKWLLLLTATPLVTWYNSLWEVA